MSSARALVVVAALALAGAASATAPPVGPLPAQKVTRITTTRGSFFSVTVPVRGGGYVWRIARRYNPRVVGQVGEADVGPTIVLVFKAVGRGRTSVVVAETTGATAKAYRAVRYDVTVR